MHIVCIICTEILNPDQDVMIMPCGHLFHLSCITNWFKTSKTCATCRSASSNSSLIKVYFEKSDDTKIQDLHNELLTANTAITKELDELKESYKFQQDKLRETSSELTVIKEKLKSFERTKQCDDMALAGFRAHKVDSEKEIIKLKEQINTLALDLLAEKQLRRIHQTTLNKFDADNADYNTSTILNDENLLKRQEEGDGEANKNYSITPFWKLSCEANSANAKKDPPSKESSKPYVIPSKIQKAGDNKMILQRPRYWQQETRVRSHINKLPIFTLKDLSDSKAANSSQVPQLKHKMPTPSFMSFSTDLRDNQPSTSTQKIAFNFGSDHRSLFKFGDSPSSAQPTSSSSVINFTFKSDNSNAQDGFKILNESLSPSTSSASSNVREQPTTSTASTYTTSTKKFTFGPKVSDR